MDSIQTLSLSLQSQLGSGPSLTARGAWDIAVAYVANDSVTRSGKTYINILANTGSDPASDNGIHWALSSGVPQPATIAALQQAIFSAAAAMLQSRISRRVGILNASTDSTWNMLIGGCGVGDVAQNFTECREVANLYASVQPSIVAQINPNDHAITLANVPASSILAIANQLVAAAQTYEGFTTETLPS